MLMPADEGSELCHVCNAIHVRCRSNALGRVWMDAFELELFVRVPRPKPKPMT